MLYLSYSLITLLPIVDQGFISRVSLATSSYTEEEQRNKKKNVQTLAMHSHDNEQDYGNCLS